MATLTLTPVPKATPAQRLEIRKLLDESFDDAAGMYLAGMSDQAVADKVGVPTAVVERIRENGWGPILVTPEMLSIREEVAEVRKQIKALLDTEFKAIVDKIETLQKHADRLEARANSLSQKKAA